MQKEQVVAHSPNDLALLLVKCMNEGDSAGTAMLYEEDAVLSIGSEGQVITGRAAIRAFYAELAAKRTKFDVGRQRPR